MACPLFTHDCVLCRTIYYSILLLFAKFSSLKILPLMTYKNYHSTLLKATLSTYVIINSADITLFEYKINTSMTFPYTVLYKHGT